MFTWFIAGEDFWMLKIPQKTKGLNRHNIINDVYLQHSIHCKYYDSSLILFCIKHELVEGSVVDHMVSEWKQGQFTNIYTHI